jgi:Arc/MetJ-type ribon-helix-helix transcriptional regulator
MADWKTGVALTSEIVREIDECVASDKYPMGKYHSHTHFVIEVIKEKLEKENNL